MSDAILTLTDNTSFSDIKAFHSCEENNKVGLTIDESFGSGTKAPFCTSATMCGRQAL